MVIKSQSHSEYKLPLKETQETSILATWQPNPLTNQSSSPCYLFLATCFVISVSRYNPNTEGRDYKIQHRVIVSNSSIKPQNTDAFRDATSWRGLGRHCWVQSCRLIRPANPEPAVLPVLRTRGKCAVVREEISGRGKLLRVSAPWRVLLRHWRGHLFRFLPLTAGAVPI